MDDLFILSLSTCSSVPCTTPFTASQSLRFEYIRFCPKSYKGTPSHIQGAFKRVSLATIHKQPSMAPHKSTISHAKCAKPPPTEHPGWSDQTPNTTHPNISNPSHLRDDLVYVQAGGPILRKQGSFRELAVAGVFQCDDHGSQHLNHCKEAVFSSRSGEVC